MSSQRCYFVLFGHDKDTVEQRIAVDPEVYLRWDMDVIISGGRMYIRDERSQRFVRAIIYDHDAIDARGNEKAGPQVFTFPARPTDEGNDHGAPTT